MKRVLGVIAVVVFLGWALALTVAWVIGGGR